MDNNTELYKELQPGTVLNAGKYIIEKKIGEGGFGITYKAVQTGLNRAVCIKEYFLAGSCVRNTQARTVHLQGISDEKYEKYRQAFVKEAQTLASLRHPNIVEVIDIFDENNTSYMVMPFVEGETLQRIVEKKGPLTCPEAVNYMAQIATAVGYVHDRHILHRDIKPDNIMVTSDYKAILIDFGSAREFQQDKTQVHTSMLTHGYAPPEQYASNSRKGSYTDIYAIGATLYFVLTGQVPTEAAARLTEKMPEPKELNPAIPDEINRTILKAMQLKTENRHQTIRQFMDDLQNVKPSKPIKLSSDVPVGTSPKGGRAGVPVSGHPWSKVWIPVLVILMILLGGVVVVSVISKKKHEAEQIARLVEIHDDKTESCGMLVGNVVRDRDGNEGNKLVIIQSLKYLQEIERMESRTNFNEMGVKPMYGQLFAVYLSNLRTAASLVEEKYQRQVELGLEDNSYCDELRERLDLINNILKQAEQGSAMAIELEPPKSF